MADTLITLLIVCNVCGLIGFALGYKTGYSVRMDDERKERKAIANQEPQDGR